MEQTINFNRISLERLSRVEVSWDESINFNYKYLSERKPEIKGFFKFLNPFLLLEDEAVLNKKTNKTKIIETKFSYDPKYFINPFDNKWYEPGEDYYIKSVPYIRLHYYDGGIHSYLGITKEVMEKTYNLIQNKLKDKKELFVDLNTGNEL